MLEHVDLAGEVRAALEAALRGGRHPLAPVYAAGQDLLTEIRLASEAVER